MATAPVQPESPSDIENSPALSGSAGDLASGQRSGFRAEDSAPGGVLFGDEWIAGAEGGGPHASTELTSESPDERARRHRVSGIVFLTVFIDFLGLGVLLPVIPHLVERFEDSALAVGVLGAAFALAQFVATPALGALSDRVGRRAVLGLSLFGSAVGYAVLGLAGALWVMLLARVIDGVTGANISTAQAALADVTPASRRSRSFALIGVAMGLGFVLGPMLGGVLADKAALTAPVFTAGALSLIAGVFALWRMPETLPPSRRRSATITLRELNPLAHAGWGWRIPGVRWGVLALVCVGVPFAALSNNLGVYLDRVYAMGPRDAAMLFSWMGVVIMLMQGVVVRRLSGTIDDRAMARAGLLIFGVGLLVIAFTPVSPGWTLVGLYTGIAMFAAGHALTSPTLTGVVSRAAPSGHQGAAMGISTSMVSLTRVAGPLLGGVMFDHVAPNSPYWSGVIWVGVAMVMVVMLGGGGGKSQLASGR
ncbi:MAG: MFS transporter [Phycisphaerales bacterium]